MASTPDDRDAASFQRHRSMITAVTVAVSVLFLGWVVLGVVRSDHLPGWYWWVWVPALPVVVPVLVLSSVSWFREQDYSPQPWGARAEGVVDLFRWRSGAGREWGLWLLSVGAIPFALVGLIHGGPEFDRWGSGLLLVGCSVIGWIGLKMLDARIARSEGKTTRGG